MSAVFANANWIAVVVSLVACMALGFLWYNPKFPTGKVWAEGAGVSPEPPDEFPALAMAMNTIGLFLAAVFVGGMYQAGLTSVTILAILAYGALNTAGGLFAGKSVSVGLIHIGYWLVGMVVIIAVHSILG